MNAERLIQLYDRVSDAPDAIPRLRRFILDLAVRGRLAGAFQDWKTTTLGQVGTWGSGGTPLKSHPEYYGGDIPWLVIGDLNDGLVTSAQSFITQKGLENSSAKIVEPGTVLIAMYGSIGKLGITGIRCATNQAIAFCVPHSSGVTKDYFFLLLKSLRETLLGKGQGVAQQNISQKILKAHEVRLPSLVEQHRIVAKVDELMTLCDSLEAEREKREATRDRLTTASLSRLTAPVVDEKQFKAHADFAIKVLPELTTRPDQINVLRQTILDLAVRGKLVEQDPNDERAGEFLKKLTSDRAKPQKALDLATTIGTNTVIPESWIWLRLGNLIGKMDAGWSPQCESRSVENEKEWGVLKTTAVQTLDFDARQNKRLPPKLRPRPEYEPSVGDILVTRAGPKNRVGVSCVVDIPCPRLIISDKLIRIRLLDGLSPYYVVLALNAGYTFEQLEAAKSGMAVMQMNISQAKLSAVPIPFPPLAEQQRIVEKVNKLLAQCSELEQRLSSRRTTIAKLFEALLGQAFEPLASAAA